MIASLADGVSEQAQTGDEDQVSLTHSSDDFTAACKRELAFKTARYADYRDGESK